MSSTELILSSTCWMRPTSVLVCRLRTLLRSMAVNMLQISAWHVTSQWDSSSTMQPMLSASWMMKFISRSNSPPTSWRKAGGMGRCEARQRKGLRGFIRGGGGGGRQKKMREWFREVSVSRRGRHDFWWMLIEVRKTFLWLGGTQAVTNKHFSSGHTHRVLYSSLYYEESSTLLREPQSLTTKAAEKWPPPLPQTHSHTHTHSSSQRHLDSHWLIHISVLVLSDGISQMIPHLSNRVQMFRLYTAGAL